MTAAQGLDAESPHYLLDADDVIRVVNAAWTRFAEDNAAAHLTGSVIGTSVFAHVTDPSTVELYKRMYARVRQGRAVTVPFRCDAPSCRRFMELRMRPEPQGGIQCEAVTTRVERRSRVPLLDFGRTTSREVLVMCGWCKRIPVGFKWLEAEDAVVALGLFHGAHLPAISHGICPACTAALEATLAQAR